MAGLFGLFGNKTKYVDEPTMDNESSSGEAFFLKPDDAKTLGNVDYMRQSKVIKRTFPKRRNSQGGAIIQQVSATEKTNIEDKGLAKPESNGNGVVAPATSENSQRRQSDSSMDMFRQMAKEMKN